MATGTLTESRVTLDFQPPVARLTLQHPPLNVIDIAMMDELAQAMAEIEARTDVSTLVLSGAGKSFSVGVDVAAHTPDKVADMLAKFHTVIRALVGSRKVTIAAVHGHCLGGGAELAMVCDLVYTVDTASWGFPEIELADTELELAVKETVQQLSSLSPAALAITKKANYAWDSMHFDKGLARAEKIYLDELMKTEDVHEGINAFLEKRQPVWKGK
jgi:cyclohexa-1,5-dienecarbonyl-CoA hydratase